MSIERIEVNGHELTAFDLPPEPSETYHVWVDGLGDVVVEKGKPPKEKDVPAMYMRKLVPELCEQNAELHRENAKLRELACILAWCAVGADCDKCPINTLDFSEWPNGREICYSADDRMRELGVETTE